MRHTWGFYWYFFEKKISSLFKTIRKKISSVGNYFTRPRLWKGSRYLILKNEYNHFTAHKIIGTDGAWYTVRGRKGVNFYMRKEDSRIARVWTVTFTKETNAIPSRANTPGRV